jgi:hypothetical protein
MRNLSCFPAASLLVTLSGGALAQPPFRDIAVNRTLVRGGVKVTLRKITLACTAPGVQMALAEFRITDTAGRPLALVRGAKLTLVEAKASGIPLLGQVAARDPTRLDLDVAGLRDADLGRVRTVTLDVQAASLTPAKEWTNVPVQAGSGTPPGVPVYRDAAVEASVTGAYRGTYTASIGHRTIPTVTVEVTETAHGKFAQAGFVRVEGAGLRHHEEGRTTLGNRTTYEAVGELTGSRLPERVTIRYYSSAAATRALKSYRFVFTDMKL